MARWTQTSNVLLIAVSIVLAGALVVKALMRAGQPADPSALPSGVPSGAGPAPIFRPHR